MYVGLALISVFIAFIILTFGNFSPDSIVYDIAKEGDKLLVEINGWLGTNIVLPQMFLEAKEYLFSFIL